MWRTVLIYGAILAAGAFALQWLQFQLLVRTHPLEIYLAIFALAFMALGRVGRACGCGAALPRKPFEVNTQAQRQPRG